MPSTPGREGIVVLGVPRSGTTLVRRLLDAHPAIACPGETNVLAACGRFLRSDTIAEGVDIGVLSGLAFAGFDEAAVVGALREFAFGFHRDYARRQGKPRWAMKSAFDVFYLDLIERLCGDAAYFLCIQRHGLDVAVSLREFCDKTGAYLSELHGYVAHYPRPLEAFCHVWVDLSVALRAFVERHPDNALLMRYEDLTADPVTATQTIARFLDVEWTPDWLAEAMGTPLSIGFGDWKTYAKGAVETDSVGRWHGLSEHTIGMMGRICNPMLEASGYPAVETKGERSTEEARRRYALGLRVTRPPRSGGDVPPRG